MLDFGPKFSHDGSFSATNFALLDKKIFDKKIIQQFSNSSKFKGREQLPPCPPATTPLLVCGTVSGFYPPNLESQPSASFPIFGFKFPVPFLGSFPFLTPSLSAPFSLLVLYYPFPHVDCPVKIGGVLIYTLNKTPHPYFSLGASCVHRV